MVTESKNCGCLHCFIKSKVLEWFYEDGGGMGDSVIVDAKYAVAALMKCASDLCDSAQEDEEKKELYRFMSILNDAAITGRKIDYLEASKQSHGAPQ